MAEENVETIDPGEVSDSGNAATDALREKQQDGVDANAPDFANLKEQKGKTDRTAADLNRLSDVEVAVSAELGRAKVSIQQLLQWTEGSVFELNRKIESPVELIAQGVPLGNGEVVVVNGNFAVRIQEIYAKG